MDRVFYALSKVINVFRSENIALFTVTSFQIIRKNRKNRNSETKCEKQLKNQGSNRSKNRKIALIIKNSDGK